MRFSAVIEKYFSDIDFDLRFNQENFLNDMNVPDNIAKFFAGANADTFDFTSEDLATLNNELAKIINDEFHDAILFFIYKKLLTIYDFYKNEISEYVAQIQKDIQSDAQITQKTFDNIDHYKKLLNIHLFINSNKQRNFYRGCYPQLSYSDSVTLEFDVPFAINALSLIGAFPKGQTYIGMKLGEPIYPKKLAKSKKELLPLKRGIKQSEMYFPFKRIMKITTDVNLKDTFLITNGKKLLYVRGVYQYSPNAVLASKIASFVSHKHFSSERLLDNNLVASRKLAGYAISAADFNAPAGNGLTVKEVRKNFIEVQKKVIPGTGIIDEVLNFIRETDENPENYAYSSSDIAHCYLTKIDFDCCTFLENLPLEQDPKKWWELYEKDILTKMMYRLAPSVKSDKVYINEKLRTRLKLAIMPREFYANLANKAYLDEVEKEAAVNECVNRTEIAFNLFLDNPYTKNYLKENPNILNELIVESIPYVNAHFSESETKNISMNLKLRVQMIHQKMSELIEIAPLNKFLEINESQKPSFFQPKSDKPSEIESLHETTEKHPKL